MNDKELVSQTSTQAIIKYYILGGESDEVTIISKIANKATLTSSSGVVTVNIDSKVTGPQFGVSYISAHLNNCTGSGSVVLQVT